MSKFWSAIVHDLSPYIPGEQPAQTDLIKLNTNENPYPPAPGVLVAISAHTDSDLRLYPDPDASELKQAIGDYHHLPASHVFVGNGSDEVLAHAFQAFFKHDDAPLLCPDISYSFYPVYCGLYQIPLETVQLTDDFSIDIADYERAQGEISGIIFPNPNAPTGKLLALDAIEALLVQQPDRIVLVDEAYIDFGGKSAVILIKQYPNLLVVQTLSKSRSLAGMRIGFALGQPELIDGLTRVKDSFNSYPMDRLAIAAGVAAMQDEAYFKQCCQAIIDSRESLTIELNTLGFEVVPSAANFVFAKHPKFNASDIAASLRKQNIIVRYFDKPRINQHLRITIGSETENKKLVDALKITL